MRLLIVWHVVHRNHPKEIELCGLFDSAEHFERVKRLEAQRGWRTARWQVIREVLQ